MNTQTHEITYSTNLSCSDTYDVVIAGGGPSGFAAGISAARLGAKTLLLESSGALGGMATQGLVTAYDGLGNGHGSAVGGIMREILDRMHDEGLLAVYANPKSWRENYCHPTRIDPEACKRFFDRMAQEAGLELRFFSRAVDVIKSTSAKHIDGVIVSGIDGLSAISCKTLIDCSGDATLAVTAGVDYNEPLHDSGQCLPASLCFTVANIDHERAGNWRDYVEQALADNHFRNCEVRFVAETIQPGVVAFNAGHLYNIDATNPQALSQAMIEGRDIAEEHVSFLRTYVPGFERCLLTATAPLLGVRQTRQIHGECTLTKEDYISGRQFPDQIGCYTKEPDFHTPNPSPEILAEIHHNRDERLQWLPPGSMLGLPYGIMVPSGGWDNLWVAGRSVSLDDFTQSSARVMPCCAMMGEAAGAAAVQHLQTGQAAYELDTGTLVKTLRAQGALLPQKELSTRMTRGSGKERGATPVVRMHIDDPHPPSMQAILKPQKSTLTENEMPARPDDLRNSIQQTCKRLCKTCCRSSFTAVEKVCTAIDQESQRCSDHNLLVLAENLQDRIDNCCCQSSFHDDGSLQQADLIEQVAE